MKIDLWCSASTLKKPNLIFLTPGWKQPVIFFHCRWDSLWNGALVSTPSATLTCLGIFRTNMFGTHTKKVQKSKCVNGEVLDNSIAFFVLVIDLNLPLVYVALGCMTVPYSP